MFAGCFDLEKNKCGDRIGSGCLATPSKKNTSETQCCKIDCIGGCTKIGSKEKCVACRHVTYQGQCFRNCPVSTYKVKQSTLQKRPEFH